MIVNLGTIRAERKGSSEQWQPLEMLREAIDFCTKSNSKKAISVVQLEDGSYKILTAGMDRHEALIALDTAYKFHARV